MNPQSKPHFFKSELGRLLSGEVCFLDLGNSFSELFCVIYLFIYLFIYLREVMWREGSFFWNVSVIT